MDKSALKRGSRGCELRTLKPDVIGALKTITIDLQPSDLLTEHDQDTPMRVSCFFPSSRGVAEFFADDGSTILIAATGHLRSFIAQRMNEDGEPSSRANLAPITTRIVAYPTGSALESDWIVLERSRSVQPELYTKINEQNRRSLVVMDSNTGTWRVEDTMSLDELKSYETVIGPILTKKTASALGDALDDVFELCRYPKELAQAPHGCACAYKEMGRCPGACDGSETMESYLGRFELAVRVASIGVHAWKRSIQEEIQTAIWALDFESAQRCKRQLETVEHLPIDALSAAGALDGFSCACVTPTVRMGWAMVWVFGGEGLVPLVAMRDETKECERLVGELALRWCRPMGFDRVQLDRLALITRHWMTKQSRTKRRHVTILDLRDPRIFTQIRDAIACACTPTDQGYDDEEHTHISED